MPKMGKKLLNQQFLSNEGVLKDGEYDNEDENDQDSE